MSASGSPRRRELLEQLGLSLTIVSPDVDETPFDGEDPVVYVRRLAIAKAFAVEAAPDALVIAADTTVDLGGEILAKPDDAAHAADMLRRLSARTHRVHTGVAVRLGDRFAAEVVTSLVTFVPLTPAVIEWYVATGEPMDKDLYELPKQELMQIPHVCGSLREALGALEADHEFLLAGGVFDKDQIESYIDLKWAEVYRFEHTPHPVEFEMYYSA